MKYKKNSHVFFIELIVVVLFFSMSIVIALQFFVKAHLIQQLSQQKSEGEMAAQNVIERFKADASLSTVTGNQSKEIIYFYDKDWNLQDNNGDFKLVFTVNKDSKEAGNLYGLIASVIRMSDEYILTQLSTDYYIPIDGVTQ